MASRAGSVTLATCSAWTRGCGLPMEASVALQRSVGIDTRLVSPVEMRELEPPLRADDLVAGCYEPASGYCNPVETAQAFARAARAAGDVLDEAADRAARLLR